MRVAVDDILYLAVDGVDDLEVKLITADVVHYRVEGRLFADTAHRILTAEKLLNYRRIGLFRILGVIKHAVDVALSVREKREKKSVCRRVNYPVGSFLLGDRVCLLVIASPSIRRFTGHIAVMMKL